MPHSHYWCSTCGQDLGHERDAEQHQKILGHKTHTKTFDAPSHTHGGSRKGAGRKLSPNRMVKVAVTLTNDQLAYLDAIEIESRSSIIRQLLDQWMSQDTLLKPAGAAGEKE